MGPGGPEYDFEAICKSKETKGPRNTDEIGFLCFGAPCVAPPNINMIAMCTLVQLFASFIHFVSFVRLLGAITDSRNGVPDVFRGPADSRSPFLEYMGAT